MQEKKHTHTTPEFHGVPVLLFCPPISSLAFSLANYKHESLEGNVGQVLLRALLPLLETTLGFRRGRA